jgi:hypothetical protein
MDQESLRQGFVIYQQACAMIRLTFQSLGNIFIKNAHLGLTNILEP